MVLLKFSSKAEILWENYIVEQNRYYFSIMKKYYTCFSDVRPQGVEILMLETPRFKFKWFTDCGEWFIYLIFGKHGKYIRFSSVGTTSNFIRR